MSDEMQSAATRPTAGVGRLVKIILGFTVLLVLGYSALIALSPRAREWATAPDGPTRFKVVNRILALPARVLGKSTDADTAGGQPLTREALLAMMEKPAAGPANKPAQENTEADPLPAANPPPDAAVPAAEPAAPVAPAQVTLPGGIVVTSASPAGGPVVSPSFFFWVVNLNVSGVYQSDPHRIMLDNRLVYEGDEVNRPLGVTFDRLDAEKKIIVFRDQSGALVTRSY